MIVDSLVEVLIKISEQLPALVLFVVYSYFKDKTFSEFICQQREDFLSSLKGCEENLENHGQAIRALYQKVDSLHEVINHKAKRSL